MTAPFISTLSRDYALTGDLSDSVVDIHDISMSLARITRYTGHTLLGWSVAQHSLLVLRMAQLDYAEAGDRLPPSLARALLLHDAHEAYTGDVASPIKLALGNAWADFEAKHANHVRAALGVSKAMSDHMAMVKHYDLAALRVERDRLLGAQRDRKPWTVIDNNAECWTRPSQRHADAMRELQEETHTRRSATEAFMHAYQRTTLAVLAEAPGNVKETLA